METNMRIRLMFRMLLTAASLSLCSAHAVGADPKAVSIATELKALHKSGIEMRKSFDESNESSLRACAAKSQPLRAKAMALRDRANALDTFAGDGAYDDAVDLDVAIDRAMSCLYCANRGAKSCAELGATLKKLDARWAGKKAH